MTAPADPSLPVLPSVQPPSTFFGYSVVGAAALVTVLQGVEAVAAHRAGARLLSAYRNDGDLPAALQSYELVGGALAVAQLTTIVLTGFWLLHLRRFVERVNPAFTHSRRRWWAFGGWLVPLAFLAVPYQFVRDLRGSLSQQLARRSVPVGAWWTLLLLNEFVDRRVVASRLDSQDPQIVADVGLFETGNLVFCLPALLLWFVVVTRLTDAAHRVPEDVLRRTAVITDPHPYDVSRTAPGAPIYGPPHG